MTALLTDNLSLLAGAPNGIKKLRELILELAVRGKLVPQDPSDEPASELLKRIAAEKARLVAEGKLKKQKSLNEIANEERPFELPTGWEWSHLGRISSDVQYGFTASANHQSGEPLLLRITDIQNDGVNWNSVPGCDISPREITGYELKDGDIVIARTGGTIGKSYLVSGLTHSAVFASYLIRIGRLDAIFPDFTKVFLGSQLYWKQLYANSMGTGQPNVNGTALKGLLIPLAPMEEQHRIVAKVDELMTLCDRMEAQQTDSESAHAQLVQVLLDDLTQTNDANDFATNWQRLAEHFHTLFTTESSIDALRQTLLHFAADGRLVSSAAPADYLALSDVIDGDSLNGSSKKPQDSPGAVEILRISAGTGVADFLTDENEHKWADVTEAETKKFLLAKDDLLACRFNGNLHYVGAFSLYCGTRGVPQIFPDKLIRFRANRSKASPHYLKYILNAAPARAQIESFCATTVGNIGISAKNLKTIKLRLPSLQEQSKIVDLLDKLLALCDQLKNRVTLARQLNAQLASTLVERALSDKSQQTPAVSDRQVPRTLLAAEITHRLHSQRTFGQRKLQKVIYLAEHAARLAAIQGNYLRDAAGPHDRQLMNKVEGQMQTHQWYERIERETVGHAYRPLSQAGQHRQAYSSAWSAAERATLEQVIELMRDWDTDRCEMTVTLYAAWNDFILEGRPISDEAIVNEVMRSWNDTKLRFGKAEWLAILTEMKKHTILMPTGFGKRTKGGMLSLPGFE
ncbi:restriction endonuclease subunit S [Pseudomonas sp. FSL R10-0056]|uniref:restriction endonuclease subunit S n=1 Tax=unclassified Pseudomonas TaxID=196821 RepID=UPI00129627FD|nr:MULTISPECIES: restriction endonuclease subunit S [unclassified Pseudomonas]MQT62318.1 restriction endonuclease subunit S [Pseudomonas sp. FSL R10-0056]MQT68804.1 restriction endonuclease subunit S [Pseudomonas sp. FSL R10-0071]MQU49975.1 restriction endonuclease subunit S [Pseudomonas sp. FSL A6-1183]